MSNTMRKWKSWAIPVLKERWCPIRATMFFVTFLFAVLFAAGSGTVLLAEGQCAEFPVAPFNDPSICMLQIWRPWVTACSNYYTNPNSVLWQSSFSFAYLDDGQPAVATSCGFETYDLEGKELLYSVEDRTGTSMKRGGAGGLDPGQTNQYKLSIPASPVASLPNIAGPISYVCYSKDPAVLRNKIVITSGFAQLTPEGEKTTEVSETISLKSSWVHSFPLNEGKDGSNIDHIGVAVTNLATRQQTGGAPVVVRITISDQFGLPGPYRDIVLAAPEKENPIVGSGAYLFFPGETKGIVLWTLFGDKPYEGNELFRPYPNGSSRGEHLSGTVTVKSLSRTPIAVLGVRTIDPRSVMTAVPASPIQMP